jgi:PAS domain S-box-containing protein
MNTRREGDGDSHQIVDSIPGFVATFTPSGDVEFVNRPALDYFGTTLDALRQWESGLATHPDDLPRVVDQFTRAIASGEPFDFEVRARRFDGVYRWFQSRGYPLRDADGHVVRWYNLLIDIDERKRAEEELRRSEAFLNMAQRLTLTGSIWWEVATERLIWSDETFRIMDVPRTDTPTIALALSRVHPDDLTFVRERVDRSTSDGVNMDLDCRLLMSNGSVKHVHVLLQNVAPDADRPVFVGAVRDVTAGKLAQEALNQAGAELAHVSRVTALGALTASIAHEVNQPLSGIVTNAGTCLRMLDASPPDIDGARETARRTIRDGHRASEVVGRLRALFSKRDVTLERLDLNEAAREVVALASSDLRRQRIVVRFELASDIPWVTGDRVQLQQVILNLLRNASDAMADVSDRPRQLVIRTERDGASAVRLTIRDVGAGLPPEVLGSLFDAFYTTKTGGMGIGLFVSSSIIQKHRGRLWAEPNDGGPGATFAFTLPSALSAPDDTDTNV